MHEAVAKSDQTHSTLAAAGRERSCSIATDLAFSKFSSLFLISSSWPQKKNLDYITTVTHSLPASPCSSAAFFAWHHTTSCSFSFGSERPRPIATCKSITEPPCALTLSCACHYLSLNFAVNHDCREGLLLHGLKGERSVGIN
jgi:hypothetical protein